jgi:hypothetical protein
MILIPPGANSPCAQPRSSVAPAKRDTVVRAPADAWSVKRCGVAALALLSGARLVGANPLPPARQGAGGFNLMPRDGLAPLNRCAVCPTISIVPVTVTTSETVTVTAPQAPPTTLTDSVYNTVFATQVATVTVPNTVTAPVTVLEGSTITTTQYADTPLTIDSTLTLSATDSSTVTITPTFVYTPSTTVTVTTTTFNPTGTVADVLVLATPAYVASYTTNEGLSVELPSVISFGWRAYGPGLPATGCFVVTAGCDATSFTTPDCSTGNTLFRMHTGSPANDTGTCIVPVGTGPFYYLFQPS